MDALSQYGPPKKPRQPSQPASPVQPNMPSGPNEPVMPPVIPKKDPGWLESFMGGFRSGYDNPTLSAEDAYRLYVDTRLSPEQWLQKYPDKTLRDYKIWRRRAMPVRFNWMQKMIWPKGVRERMKRRI